MNGISAFIDETPESSFLPFVPRGPSEKTAVSEPGSRPPSDTKSVRHHDLGLPASRTVGDKCLLLTSHSVHGIFVRAAEQTKTVSEPRFHCDLCAPISTIQRPCDIHAHSPAAARWMWPSCHWPRGPSNTLSPRDPRGVGGRGGMAKPPSPRLPTPC